MSFDKIREHVKKLEDEKRNHPTNLDQLETFKTELAKKEGPRVGDWLIKDDGTFTRFTHDWCDSIQVGGEGGSFHLSEYGCSYSGSLDPSVKKDQMELTEVEKLGRVWIWDLGLAGASRGVYYEIPFRVYRMKKS